MKEKLTIVKVGGAVVEDEAQLIQLLKDFSAIEGKKVLVHGGGRRDGGWPPYYRCRYAECCHDGIRRTGE